jgi:hypothetical protein
MADANAPETPRPAAPAAATPAAPATAAVPTASNAPAAPAPASSSAAPAASASAVAEPPGPTPAPRKIKPKKATQRACDEKDEKGKVCCGHLKRWYDYPKEVEALIGKKGEVYRCEFCQTLYTPDLSQAPHSYTLRY